MKTGQLEGMIKTAVKLNNYPLASVISIRLAKEKNDGELWQIAGDFCCEAEEKAYAAFCYNQSARIFAEQKHIPKAIFSMQRFATVQEGDAQDIVYDIFKLPQEDQDDGLCEIQTSRPDSSSTTPQTPLLRSSIPNRLLGELLKTAKIKHYKKGDLIGREGHDAACMYLVTKGKLQTCFRANGKQHLAATISVGDCYGEMPFFLHQLSYVYSSIALENTAIVEVSYALLKKSCQEDDQWNRSFKARFKEHLLQYTLMTTLFFSDLSYADIQDFAGKMIIKSFKANEVIINHGDQKNLGVFMMRHGRVSVGCEKNGREYHLCSYESGDFFGELGILYGKRSKVSVHAVSESQLLYWPEQAYRDLYEKNYHIRDHIFASLSLYNDAIDCLDKSAHDSNHAMVFVERKKLLDGMSCQHHLGRFY